MRNALRTSRLMLAHLAAAPTARARSRALVTAVGQMASARRSRAVGMKLIANGIVARPTRAGARAASSLVVGLTAVEPRRWRMRLAERPHAAAREHRSSTSTRT